jgi:hypothetical protein
MRRGMGRLGSGQVGLGAKHGMVRAWEQVLGRACRGRLRFRGKQLGAAQLHCATARPPPSQHRPRGTSCPVATAAHRLEARTLPTWAGWLPAGKDAKLARYKAVGRAGTRTITPHPPCAPLPALISAPFPPDCPPHPHAPSAPSLRTDR